MRWSQLQEPKDAPPTALALSIVFLVLHGLLVLSLMTPIQETTPETKPALKAIPVPDEVPPIPIKFEGSGTLNAITARRGALGLCPLKHTDVQAKISGYIAKVTVTQLFINNFKTPVEAIYTFPLDSEAAVESMRIKNGDHVVTGSIQKRAVANKIYESARSAGKTAALLEQERPNIFTQSLANIAPNSKVEVTLTYVSLLPFKDGKLTFTFPTVVGPRFTPKSSIDGGMARPEVPTNDASKINPSYSSPGRRAGHDISIRVDLEHGSAFDTIASALHPIHVEKNCATNATVTLLNQKTLPNSDFVLSWHVGDKNLKTSYLTHRDTNGGFMTLMVMPPDAITADDVAGKELIFIVDCSGSQSGAPIKSAKDTLLYIIDHLSDRDTFQVLAFNDDVVSLFAKPERITPRNRQRAISFISELDANGGTYMASAIEAACAIPADNHRLKIATFMTDGFVGNDEEVLGLVRKLRGTSRWFSFGTGNSVNRFLIDGIARVGGGEAEYVLTNSSPKKVADDFWKKLSSPILTDVSVHFQGLKIKEVYPSMVSDVWSQRPLYFVGRYDSPSAGTVTLRGFRGGLPFEKKLHISLPHRQRGNESISAIWARKKIEALSQEDFAERACGKGGKHEQEITSLGLKHHILTKFTAFVAVDSKTKVHKGKEQVRRRVPAEHPDGIDAGIVGSVIVGPSYGQGFESTEYNDTYMGTQKFWGDDIIGNFFQNVGQLIAQWTCEFVDGVLADSIWWLTHAVQVLVASPTVRVETTPQFLIRSDISHIFESTLKEVYKLAFLAALMLTAWLSAPSARRRVSFTRRRLLRPLLATVGVMLSPICLMVVLQTILEIAYGIPFAQFQSIQDPKICAEVASTVREGLLSISCVIFQSLNSINGGFGSPQFHGTHDIVCCFAVPAYLLLLLILTFQLCRLAFILLAKSVIVTGQILFNPLFLACVATRHTHKIASIYLRTVAEVVMWSIVWGGLLITFSLCLVSNLNAIIKLIAGILILEVMIRTPMLVAFLHISVIANFVHLGPIRAIAAGLRAVQRSISSNIADFRANTRL